MSDSSDGASSCKVEPCILWGIPLVYFIIGCLLVVLAVFSRCVIKLLLIVLAAVLRCQGKKSWTERINRQLLVPSTWFLRMGLLLGAFELLRNAPITADTVTELVYYLFAIAFCVMWLWWSFVFLDVVSKIIVEEYVSVESRRLQKQSKAIASGGSAMESKAFNKMLQFVNRHHGILKSSRATALSQVLLIFRTMIMIVVLALVCSVLQISFTKILNDTCIWWISLLLALATHFRSIYLGTLLTFLFTDDDWTPVQAGNVCLVEGTEHASEELSLARTRMTRLDDGATVFAPLNYLFDSGAQTEGQRISQMPFVFRLEVKDTLSATDIMACCSKAEHLIFARSHAVSLSFVHFDSSSRNVIVAGSILSIPSAYEEQRGDLRMALVENLRVYLNATSTENPDEGYELCEQNFPELGFSDDATDFKYIFLHSDRIEPSSCVLRAQVAVLDL